MRQFVFLILILLPISVAFSQAWQGVDVSFLSEMEGDGVVYQDEFGADIDEPRAWMAEKGVNMVRLRVWHNPYPNLRNSWLGVAQEAAKWDSLGVSILLDYHFSDTWAAFLGLGTIIGMTVSAPGSWDLPGQHMRDCIPR